MCKNPIVIVISEPPRLSLEGSTCISFTFYLGEDNKDIFYVASATDTVMNPQYGKLGMDTIADTEGLRDGYRYDFKIPP